MADHSEEGEVGFVVYGGGGDNFLEMVERSLKEVEVVVVGGDFGGGRKK